LINTVCADVTELRSQDDNFNNLYMDAVQLCEMSDIHVEANFVAVSSARKGKLPSKFVGSCVLETRAVRRRTGGRRRRWVVLGPAAAARRAFFIGGGSVALWSAAAASDWMREH